MTNTSHEQQVFYHRESPMSNGSLYGTIPCEYYIHGLHNSNRTIYHLKAIPFGWTRVILYEGSLLLYVMIEQAMIQAALSSVENFDGTKGKFKVWTESIENIGQISGKDTLYIGFSKMTGSPLSSGNRLKAQSPKLMWIEFKRELSIQYLAIPFDSHVNQGFCPTGTRH